MTKHDPLHSVPEYREKSRQKGRALKITILVLILWLIAVMLYQTHKPLLRSSLMKVRSIQLMR